MRTIFLQGKAANLIFELVLLAVIGTGVLTSLNWPRETALLPYTFGSVVVVLLLILIARDVVALRAPDIAAPEEPTATPDSTRRAGRELLWLVLYGFAIWLVGFYPATGLYLGLYLWRIAKFSLPRSLLWAGGGTILTCGLFVGVLNIDPYMGLIYHSLT